MNQQYPKNKNKTQFSSLLLALSISFLLTFAILSSNAYAFTFLNNNSNTILQTSTPSSNQTNEPMHMNNLQMSNMNMDMNHMDMMKRGDIWMGFNQSKISHQFVITPNGGKIIVTALDNNDTQTIGQIKNHIKDIQKLFSKGNFTIPLFVHAQKVPGTDVMKNKKDLINYSVVEMQNGSSLILTTNDKEVSDAISQFMKFQATEHKGH